MTRWNTLVTLVSCEPYQDESGSVRTRTVETKAYGNLMTIGAQSWAAARSVGLHADCTVRIYASLYTGQQTARIGGVEYEIERPKATGEYCDLTLKRRLVNG